MGIFDGEQLITLCGIRTRAVLHDEMGYKVVHNTWQVYGR